MSFIKSILTVAISFFIFNSAQAALNADDVQKSLVGKYELSIEGYDVQFLIRSNGKVQILTEDAEFNSSSMSVVNSVNPAGPDGLAVAHITLMTGSDEDSQDFHILLTVEQVDKSRNNIIFISAFSTLNDGPNYYSTVEPVTQLTLKKYNKETKQFVIIKSFF